MGKREKEHRKKVQKRNERIKQETTNFQKQLKKIMEGKLEELKSETNNQETENSNNQTI
jgi:hypothetical protein